MSVRKVALIFFLVFIIAVGCTTATAKDPAEVKEDYNGLTIRYEDNIGPKNVQFVRDTWDQCMVTFTQNLTVKPNNEVEVFVFGTRSGYRQNLIAHGIPESWAFSTLGVAQNNRIFINLEACMGMAKKEKYQLLAHEFAHIWCYKLKGDRFDDVWLVESYAYYSEKLVLNALGLESMESVLKRSINRIKGKRLPKLETMQTRAGYSQAYREVDDDEVFRSYMVTITDCLLSITGQENFINYFSRKLADEGADVRKLENGAVVITTINGSTPELESNFSKSFGMDVPTFQEKLTGHIKNKKP